MPTTTLMSAAQLATTAGALTSQTIPDEARQSLPIPVRNAGSLTIAFFYCPSAATPQGEKMYPPRFLLWLDPTTGRMLELKRVTPGDFGRNDARDQMLGLLRLPDGMTADQYLEQQAALFAIYDALLPEFAHPQQPTSNATRSAAKKFNALFHVLREPPVDAYYEAVGHDFFQWVHDAARDPS
jgi:hypothetical protein